MMWPYGGFGFMGGWMILWLILGVIFWVGVVVLIVWAIRRFAGYSGPSRTHGHDALDIARERYARGEITKDQLEQIKKDLV